MMFNLTITAPDEAILPHERTFETSITTEYCYTRDGDDADSEDFLVFPNFCWRASFEVDAPVTENLKKYYSPDGFACHDDYRPDGIEGFRISPSEDADAKSRLKVELLLRIDEQNPSLLSFPHKAFEELMAWLTSCC